MFELSLLKSVDYILYPEPLTSGENNLVRTIAGAKLLLGPDD